VNIAVIGTGYVGLVTGACLANQGHSVVCADIDRNKIASLRRGVVTAYEAGLEGMVSKGLHQGTLRFTTDVGEAADSSDVVFIAVGTPPRANGEPNTDAVFAVAETIALSMRAPKTIVVKSTVPVGTTRAVQAAIASKTEVPFGAVSNPEFLREGRAVQDFIAPSRVVIGSDTPGAHQPLYDVYRGFVPEERILVIDSRSAEMGKYASNAFLATRVSFINEVANLCEALGADAELVRRVAGLDPRIGLGYFAPGVGYGGSCLPKDVEALLDMGTRTGVSMNVMAAVQHVNGGQPKRLLEKVLGHFDGTIEGRRIAVWGLAFKPGTDDVRSAPSLALIDLLTQQGAAVVAYDPEATTQAKAALNGRVEYARDQYECVVGADALVLVTEWDHFRTPDWRLMRRLMKSPAIFDGRNIYDPQTVADEGFTYHSMGRGLRAPAGDEERLTAANDYAPRGLDAVRRR
jgi:UDPglucose 6-dehydrogenase